MSITEVKSVMPTTEAKLRGTVSWRAKDADGKVVEEYSGTNNIVLQIRQPIIKLLGAFGNIQLATNIENHGWVKVPDTYVVQDVHGDIAIQVLPTTLPYVSTIAFGSDGTPATINDKDLAAPIAGAEKLLATAPVFSPDGLQVTFAIVVDRNELNNVEIREAVLRTVDGTTVARAPIGYYKKIPGMYWEFMWTIGYADE